jgi:hypothetical protein
LLKQKDFIIYVGFVNICKFTIWNSRKYQAEWLGGYKAENER